MTLKYKNLINRKKLQRNVVTFYLILRFIIINIKKKEKYLRFLFLNYVCSQPQSIEKLINDYHYQVFPYYVFQIYDSKTSTEDFYDQRTLILDYINFNITIYHKHEVEKNFLIDSIEVNKHSQLFIRKLKKEKIARMK